MRYKAKGLTMQPQRGMALFVTLIMVVIILLIMSSISYQQQLDFKRSSQMLLSDQVVLLALSGESWAKKILLEDLRDNQTDSLQDDWAQSIPVMPVEGGWLTGCIQDLHGRFNLNNLGTYTPATFQKDVDEVLASTELDVYLQLLALLELDAEYERAAVIVDWIDADDTLVIAGGAEDSEYSVLDPPRLAANWLLSDISELLSIYGYSAADLSALRPYVAALGADTKINVNTASPLLLSALLAGLGDYIVDAIIENRPYESADDFYDAVSYETGFTSAEVKLQLTTGLIDVQSSYFELNARVSIAGIEMGLRSILYREGADNVRVLSRTFEYLPRLELEEGQADPLISPCYIQEEDSLLAT